MVLDMISWWYGQATRPCQNINNMGGIMDDTNEFGVPLSVEKLFLDWVAEYLIEHPGLTAEELASKFLEEVRSKH
jgi:hypothetical protein